MIKYDYDMLVSSRKKSWRKEFREVSCEDDCGKRILQRSCGNEEGESFEVEEANRVDRTTTRLEHLEWKKVK